MGYKNIIKTMMSKSQPFIIEVKTDNSGSSSSNQFTIPTTGSGYLYTVRTSSGVTTGNTSSVTITWPTAGTYDVEISGNFPRIYFNGNGDMLKILKVKQWGTINWSDMSAAFRGCSNLDITAVDTPNLSNVSLVVNMFLSCTSLINSNGSIGNWNTSNITSMNAMFFLATKFNQNIGNWNTSNVTNMSQMFQYATQFNQNIGSWDVSKVTTFYAMFLSNTNFNNGGSDSIKNWIIKTTGTVIIQQMFQGSAFNQPINTNGLSWNTSAVTSMYAVFSGADQFNQDIGGWNVSNVVAFDYMFGSATNFNNGGSDSIKNWIIKTTGTVTMTAMFQSANSFNQPINTNGLSWNMSVVTNMGSMFASAINFNQNIGSWDVSKVTSFSNMFSSASQFNNGGSDSIKNWIIKTSGPVTMNGMFQSTFNFNQPLNTSGSSWNTSTVTSMFGMFNNTSIFNQDIGLWDTGSVTSMGSMFAGSGQFNQNIGSWNTSNVDFMASMFTNAYAFNQDIGGWDVSKVTTFSSMFSGATNFNNGGSDSIKNWVINTTVPVYMGSMFRQDVYFNQPIGTWNTSNVIDMSLMFYGSTNFNQEINTVGSSWNTSNVTNMSSMFQAATSFNRDISGWDTSNVTNMSQMFNAANNFNQDISTWNVFKVTTFNNMLLGAGVFNRNLGSWQLRLTGTVLSSIFASSGMSTANYTDTIVGWANYVQTNSGTPISVSMSSQSGRTFQNSRTGVGFANAGVARSYLTGIGWSITSDTVIA